MKSGKNKCRGVGDQPHTPTEKKQSLYDNPIKEAVKQAIAYIRYIEKRWGSHYITVKSKGRNIRQNIVMCHYNGGNSCDTNKDGRVNSRDKAVRYAFNHNAIVKLVELKWLFDEVAMTN